MQKHRILSAACCLILLPVAGVSYAASLGPVDRYFMTTAARADMAEAHEGQMAESQAHRTDVRTLARTVVQDHTESYEHLTALAHKLGVPIPKGINASRDANIRLLTGLKGERFDRHFTRAEIVAHRQEIALFKREVTRGTDSDVKAYATRMIPILEKQLHLAEECAKPSRHS